MNVKQISGETFVDRGTLRPAAQFKLDPARLRLSFERMHDDLDEYEAAYFNVNGLPVVVQRYAGNPLNQYTVSIDWGGRKPANLRPLLRAFFLRVEVPEPAVIWVADDDSED